MKEAVLVRAGRTAIGKVNGIHKEQQAHALAASVIRPLTAGLELPYDDVLLGNVVGPGGNVARVAALEAGLPLTVPGLTIDRQCSAGLEAIRLAGYLVQAGAGRCYIAGGVESTSTSPFPEKARFAPDAIGDPEMGVGAENVAKQYSITRAEQDTYALRSYEHSWQAHNAGIYAEEIVTGTQVDEVFHKQRDMKAIVKRARPLFAENGTVTAANSCQINDGAAAVIVMEAALAKELHMEPVLRFVDSEIAGVHPNVPGAAPIPAIQALLKRNRLTVADIDRFEMNEAFASKICACCKALAIPMDKVNTYGGALTTGHPYGASGAMLTTRLFYEARRSQLRYAVAAIGSGGGIGVAVLFEVV